MIEKDLEEIINKKTTKVFKYILYSTNNDILSMKQQVSRNSLNEVVKTLHSIDTKLAVEFTNTFRDSFFISGFQSI